MAPADAIVVGSGPNGLAAAVTLARSGLAVTVYEQASAIGGGSRTAELTLPGFRHDVCSAVHPMALESGFFRKFGLTERVEFLTPEISYAHPLDGGRAGIAWRDLRRTAADLGVDGPAWNRLFAPLVARSGEVARFTGSSLLRPSADPATMVRFALRSLEQGTGLWNHRFRGDVAPAMISGIAGHAIRRMPSLSTAGAGLALGTYAHARGWPIPVGGSGAIIEAMADDLRRHGAEIVTGAHITDIGELPNARAVLFDTTPAALSSIAASRLPGAYRRSLARFRYGNGVAKVDFALSGPVPWANAGAREALTLHLGGTREEIAASEADVAAGRHSDNPYVLVSQPSIIDGTRAPEGKHVLWAYTHVPRGSNVDPTEAVIAQIERFAPGFRDVILASASMSAMDFQRYNPNYIGGDIAAGAPDLSQLVVRPVMSLDPWRTPASGIYLCSSSTPPGPAVHGLAGYYAARSALHHEFGIDGMPPLGPSS